MKNKIILFFTIIDGWLKRNFFPEENLHCSNSLVDKFIVGSKLIISTFICFAFKYTIFILILSLEITLSLIHTDLQENFSCTSQVVSNVCINNIFIFILVTKVWIIRRQDKYQNILDGLKDMEFNENSLFWKSRQYKLLNLMLFSFLFTHIPFSYFQLRELWNDDLFYKRLLMHFLILESNIKFFITIISCSMSGYASSRIYFESTNNIRQSMQNSYMNGKCKPKMTGNETFPSSSDYCNLMKVHRHQGKINNYFFIPIVSVISDISFHYSIIY